MKSLLIALTLTVSSLAFSYEAQISDIQIVEELHPHHSPKKHHQCRGLKLTDNQHNQIKDMHKDLVKDIKPLKVNLKKSMMAHRKVIKTSNTTADVAQKSFQTVLAAKGKVINSASYFVHKIAFNILDENQRKPFFRCLKKMKQRRGRGHGRRGHDRRGQGRRGPHHPRH